jgi:NAD(P)-dependent dehydrogenase (short-subunit alcohol dehydrogenase family)
LICNAGVAPAASFLEMRDELWDDVLRVNLTGTYYCCKAFLPGMIRSGWGRIITIASTAAKVPYSHVSAFCPGYVDTESTRKNAQLMAEKTGKNVTEILTLFAKSSPQNRLIGPEEVAALALMLASEKAGGITGQAINVDGGAVMF